MCFRVSGPKCVCIMAATIAAACVLPAAFAQTDPGLRDSGPRDPGPRGGAAAAGAPVDGLNNMPGMLAAFQNGLAAFQEVEDVKNDGLGPRFNSNSCVSCHIQPAAGGTSPAQNPQVQFANSQNKLPSFITANGPAREARFIKNSDGWPDGGVHALFTIGGRADQPSGCNLVQEDFSRSS